jgi:hypothetical protein
MKFTFLLRAICITSYNDKPNVKYSPIYLSGNYVTPMNLDSESEYDDEDGEYEYDLSPDEEELLLDDEDSEEDELDDLNGRIEEITYRIPQ